MSRKYGKAQRPALASGEYLHFEGRDKATKESYATLLEEGQDKLPPKLWEQLYIRIQRRAAVQLSIDLKATIDCMADSDVRMVMENGLTKHEFEVLNVLHLLSTKAQLAAWEVFNIKERQELVDTLRPIYNRFKCRRFRGGNT